MDAKYTMIAGTGIVLLAAIFIIDLLVFQDMYVTGIAAIILAVIGMSLLIMQDAKSLPEIGVTLREDAKGVLVINRGNDTAYGVHIALVPHNIEFDIPSLGADATYEYAVPAMLSEVKAVVAFRNANGVQYSRTILLSALGKDDDDLLKPMFPMFRWE